MNRSQSRQFFVFLHILFFPSLFTFKHSRPQPPSQEVRGEEQKCGLTPTSISKQDSNRLLAQTPIRTHLSAAHQS
jgi:hypothetical protein